MTAAEIREASIDAQRTLVTGVGYARGLIQFTAEAAAQQAETNVLLERIAKALERRNEGEGLL